MNIKHIVSEYWAKRWVKITLEVLFFILLFNLSRISCCSLMMFAIVMQSGSDQEVQAYLDEHQLTFKVINDVDDTWVSAYGVRGVPASFVVNSDNQITSSEVGYTTGWGLRLRMWLTN